MQIMLIKKIKCFKTTKIIRVLELSTFMRCSHVEYNYFKSFCPEPIISSRHPPEPPRKVQIL